MYMYLKIVFKYINVDFIIIFENFSSFFLIFNIECRKKNSKVIGD